MAKLCPFAVQFKHVWNPHPVWETYWAEDADRAEALVTLGYEDVDQTVVPKIIKTVPLAPDQELTPPEVKRQNRRVERRNQRKEKDHEKDRTT